MDPKLIAIVQRAIKEFALIEFQHRWQETSVFVSNAMSPIDYVLMWRWASNILELNLPLAPDNVKFLIPGWTEDNLAIAIKDAELAFIRHKQNRKPIRNRRDFMAGVQRIKAGLLGAGLSVEGVVAATVFANEWLILGTETEDPRQAMSRLGIREDEINDGSDS
jgi:hypothetical protein